MNEGTVRMAFGVTAVTFAGIAAATFGLLGLVLTGGSLPLGPPFEMAELHAYMGATAGSLALGLAVACFSVVREPSRSVALWLPVSTSLFALAWMRAQVAVLSTDLSSVAPLLVAETVVFSSLAMWVALARTDSPFDSIGDTMEGPGLTAGLYALTARPR